MLRDRRILVTGGARGLGRAFAEAALGAGARVAVADILEEAGRATAKEIGATFVPLDLASAASIEACVAGAADALGGIDGLINNGAITSSGGKTLAELDVDTWDRVMAVNVRGPFLMAKHVSRHMMKARYCKIINIGSGTTFRGIPKMAHYVTS